MVFTIIEKVDCNAALINLDESNRFDRMNHGFHELVLSAASFGVHFRGWIHLLYASSEVVVEVTVERANPFTLTRSIRQDYPLSLMLYVLTLELFLRRFRLNPVQRGLTLPDSTEVGLYTAYADDVSVLVMSSAKVVEMSKEIRRNEVAAVAKINQEKSIGF